MMYPVKKSFHGDFEEAIPNWGICYWNKRWWVLFGDADENAVLGRYRNRRRAKKEITHYIKCGAAFCSHGMRKRISATVRQGGAE